MNFLVLVPRVVQSYIARFPEVQHNAYDYFNYDNRVVEERVDRGDQKSAYKGPDDLTDQDYQDLVVFAKTQIDPILRQYSMCVACDDALEKAIRSFQNGKYDGKVNAGRFNVLKKELIASCAMPIMAAKEKKEAPKKAPKKEAPKRPSLRTLRELGIKKVTDLPVETQSQKKMRDRAKGDVSIVRKPGKGLVIDK